MKRGYLFCLITFFFWGSLYVVSKYAFADLPPLTVLFLRNFIAAVLIGALVWKKGLQPIRKEHWKYFLLCSISGYFFGTGLTLMATNLMSASVASLVNAANPVFITLFAVLLLKERLTANKIIGISCSLAGVGIVIGLRGGSVSPLGLTFSILGVLTWALSCVTIRKISQYYRTEQVTFVSFALSLPICLAASIIELRSTPATIAPVSAAAILYMGIFSTAAANFLWNRSLSLLDASVCSLFYPLQPFFSTILGILLLHEQITVNFILGAVLISAGVIIGLRPARRKTSA